LERLGKVLVICTDVEHGDAIDPNVVALSQGADLLIHEAQYTSEELKTKRGWGHSSYEQALQVAEMAGAKMLAITHHDPDHDDEFLRRMERECQQRFRACVLAREKMEIAL
jgi:ribonuclease BN (tRNA processing enzyme)